MFEHAASHLHLSDGTLLRLDLEYNGVYVASEYWPNRTVRRECFGTETEMRRVLIEWMGGQ